MTQRDPRVMEIIDFLYNRGGFDGWWDDVDAETKNEILNGIEKIICVSTIQV